VMLGLQNEREWQAFCERVLLQPALSTDERFCANFKRVANRAALREIIVGAFATLDFDAVIQRLEQAQIANARVNDMQGVWEHPQLKARDRWRQVDSPAGPLPSLLPPASCSAFVPRMDPVPALGEHTEALLAELGVPPEQAARMRRAGMI
jgi:itaconate CoA-transferase